MTRRLTALAEINVDRLHGIGAAKREALGNMGIETVLDLLTHYPRRYLDRTAQAAIAELVDGQEATMVWRWSEKGGQPADPAGPGAGRGRPVRRVAAICTWSFFNQAWRAKQLREGTSVRACSARSSATSGRRHR